MQLSWLKTLVRMKRMHEIESLDSTVIAALDMAAGSFWRSVQALKEAAAMQKKIDEGDGQMVLDKQAVRELVLHCMQIHSMNATEMSGLGFENVEERQNLARSRLANTCTALREAVQACKSKCMDTFDKFKAAVPLIDEWAEDEIRRLTAPTLAS